MKWHALTILIVLISKLSAGMPPPVPASETDEVISESDLVFGAKFKRIEKSYTYQGKIPKDEELDEFMKVVTELETEVDSEKLGYRFWNEDGTPFVEKELTTEEKERNSRLGPFHPDYLAYHFDYYTVSLGENGRQFREEEIEVIRKIVLEVTKRIKGQAPDVLEFEFVDPPLSSCPHFMVMGKFKSPQRYFVGSEIEEGEKKVVYRYQPLEVLESKE